MIDSLACPFEDDCMISVKTRRACKKCRLRKCLQLGMRKDWLPGETTVVGKQSIEYVCTQPTGGIDNVSIAQCEHSHGAPVCTSLQYGDSDTSAKRECDTTSTSAAPTLTPLIGFGQQYATVTSAVAIRKLAANDQRLIEELFVACRQLAHNVTIKTVITTGHEWNRDVVVKLMEKSYLRLIEMCKQLTTFSQLCQQDQIALIKGGVSEMLFLRNVYYYDAEAHVFRPRFTAHEYEDEHAISLERIRGINSQHANIHLRFVATFDPEWAGDRTLMLLLMGITLFLNTCASAQMRTCTYNPTRALLQQTDIVLQQHNEYKGLLMRYILSVYTSASRAVFVYNALLVKLAELSQYHVTIMHFIMEASPNAIGPLLCELFDL